MGVYTVIGAGVSGIAATKLLSDKNIPFVLYDGKANLDIDSLREKHSHLSEAEIVCGKVTDELVERTDVCVISPGVPIDSELVERFRNSGKVISGEIELAYSLGKGRVCAITGTNGKTTTTSLVGKIMSLAFSDTKVVGNIGIPYTSVAAETSEDTVIVAEISSFQLETADTFHPYVSAILNITPDHLDRHHTMDCYIEMKESITKNQTKDDFCILNYDDEILRKFGETVKDKCNVVYFSSNEKLNDGVYYSDGAIWQAAKGEVLEVLDTSELQILGVHNYENASAAVAMCSAFGVSMDIIRQGLREFTAVAHRIEYVCEKRGVKFYNDSKGTNPDAAIKAVSAMVSPTYLIGGGYDKNSTYDEWIDSFGDKVRKLVLIGATAKAIEACAKSKGFEDVVIVDTLEEAIDTCYELAQPGDAILLSPACASWDMFKSYEERGDIFCEYARALKE